MEPTPSPLRVEFDHPRHRLGQLPALPGAAVVVNELTPGLKQRVLAARVVIVVLGAAALAFATERAGLPLSAGLCVFFGALPVLWLAGFFVGALLTMRRTAMAARKAAETFDWDAELQRTRTDTERVTLELNNLGLRVTRRPPGSPEESDLVGWQRVSLTRLSPDAAIIGLEPHFPLTVPASAFPDAAAFDAFCLAVQQHIWAAQRR